MERFIPEARKASTKICCAESCLELEEIGRIPARSGGDAPSEVRQSARHYCCQKPQHVQRMLAATVLGDQQAPVVGPGCCRGWPWCSGRNSPSPEVRPTRPGSMRLMSPIAVQRCIIEHATQFGFQVDIAVVRVVLDTAVPLGGSPVGRHGEANLRDGHVEVFRRRQ